MSTRAEKHKSYRPLKMATSEQESHVFLAVATFVTGSPLPS
jgi:hypothetical protein